MVISVDRWRTWTPGPDGLLLDASPDEYRRWEGCTGPELARHRTGWLQAIAASDSPAAIPTILKVYLYPTARDRRRGWLRNTALARSRARREADNLRALGARGLNPDLLLAAGEHRRFGVLHASFVATRHWPSTDLARWLPASEGSSRRRCLEELGQLVARLHAAGYVDRDLHLRNLLRAEDGRLAKIDTSRGSFGPPHRRATRRDLDDLSREIGVLDDGDRRRVLVGYLRGSPEHRDARASARRAAASCRRRRSPGPR